MNLFSSYEALAVKQLAALAQGSRLALFRRLVVAGTEGLTAGELAHDCQIGATSVSFHMKELLHAGLVRSEVQGRYVRYFAEFQSMKILLDFMTDNCCGGQPCLTCEPVEANMFPSSSSCIAP
jgi:ArsR family transcriptional regulator